MLKCTYVTNFISECISVLLELCWRFVSASIQGYAFSWLKSSGIFLKTFYRRLCIPQNNSLCVSVLVLTARIVLLSLACPTIERLQINHFKLFSLHFTILSAFSHQYYWPGLIIINKSVTANYIFYTEKGNTEVRSDRKKPCSTKSCCHM